MKIYTRQEAYDATLKYFNEDILATNVFLDKYSLKNNEGELLELNPDDTHHRIAKEIARIEKKYENPMTEQQVYEFIKGFKYFVFGGSGMYGIGNDYSLSSLANCFVIGNDSDSYGGILTDDQELVQLMKRRGGVGLDLSHLRPEGTKTTNSAGNSSGAVSFASRYSNSTREVAQGGGRRGALMLSMSIKHPDVEQFVFCKNDKTKVTGANISVKVDKEFMDAVKNDGDYFQTFPIELIHNGQPIEYNTLISVKNGYIKKIKARELWNKIIHQATVSAEPGVLFWNTIKEESIPSCYGKEWEESSTNPCFTGDTIIAVADGRNGISIKELVEKGEEFLVYSARLNKSTGNHSGGWKPEIKRAKAFKTGEKQIIQITLSDDSKFKCTPDHLLATKQGKYIQAKDSKDIILSLKRFDDQYGSRIKELEPLDLNIDLTEDVFVKNIEYLGFESVYDLNVEENHNFYIITKTDDDNFLNSSGVLVHNCGEIPLNQYDSCRLSSLNLYSYVENPFTKEASFNWDLFKEHCQLGQRLMDDLVDLEEEKVNQIIAKVEQDKQSSHIKHIELVLWEKIRKTLLQGRRTGFGITGEADMLAALGLKYGTKEATEFAILIHKTLAVEAYKSSIQLAKERGCFPIWNREKEMNNPFIERIIKEVNTNSHFEKDEDGNIKNPPVKNQPICDFIEDYFNYGRRNISCLTIAPNGTLSLMTQTTSGIEPVFEVIYKRRRKVFTNTEIKDQTGDNWEEYKVFHPKFIEWYLFNSELTSYQSVLEYFSQLKDDDLKFLIKGSPYYQATANEIDYLEKVKMQGEIQKWIDHSISVTHNLPKGISEEEVAKIYMKAYEVGCKGVTVYVDGSRSGVLIKNEENLVKTNLNKRPESLQCDIYVTKVKGKDWVVLIGVNNDVPYECFAFKQKNLKITHDLPNARLIKRKEKGVNYYDLLANSHFRLDDISSFFELGEEQSLTRSISLSLRYNIPIIDICDQLDKATGSVVELSKALLRVLKKYIKEGNIGKECPNCGSKDGLVSQGGCITCKDCGYSKC